MIYTPAQTLLWRTLVSGACVLLLAISVVPNVFRNVAVSTSKTHAPASGDLSGHANLECPYFVQGNRTKSDLWSAVLLASPPRPLSSFGVS